MDFQEHHQEHEKPRYRTGDIFANHVSDNLELIKKNTTQLRKLAEDQNRHFWKEDIKIANKHMTRCSTPFIITELTTKTAMRYQLG